MWINYLKSRETFGIKQNEKENAEARPTLKALIYLVVAIYLFGIIAFNLNIYGAGEEEVTCEPSMSIPTYSYEGHKVMAQNYSTFKIGMMTKTVREAYEMGLFTEDFDVVGGGGHITTRFIPGKAEMVFSQVGDFFAKLYITLSNGTEYEVSDGIQIKSTPDIIDQLYGNQKENRKQGLNVSVAVNPSYPLEEFYVEIVELQPEDAGSAGGGGFSERAGTKINLTDTSLPGVQAAGAGLGAGAEEQGASALGVEATAITGGTDTSGVGATAVTGGAVCSETVKARAMVSGSETGHSAAELQYFAEYEILFVTKDWEQLAGISVGKSDKHFEYYIYAEDSRGQVDEVRKQFVVKPDLAPEPVLGLQTSYTREKGSNIAKIVVEDMTVSVDGDATIREWELIDLSVASVGAVSSSASQAGSEVESELVGTMNVDSQNGVITEYKDLSFGSGKKVEFEKVGVGEFQVRLKVTDDWQGDTLAEFMTPVDYTVVGSGQDPEVRLDEVVQIGSSEGAERSSVVSRDEVQFGYSAGTDGTWVGSSEAMLIGSGVGSMVGLGLDGETRIEEEAVVGSWVSEVAGSGVGTVEYEEVRWGEGVGVSQVENIAPVVSVETMKVQAANLLLIAAGPEEASALENQSELKQEFLRQGIDAKIKVVKIPEPILTKAEASGPKTLFTAITSYGYEGRWTSLEQESYAVDNTRYYILEATWPGQGLSNFPIMPYTLHAYDIGGAYNQAKSGQTVPDKAWSLPINSQTINITNTSSFYFGQDDEEMYLYLVCDGKTLLIDKKTGALLNIFSFAFGRNNYLTDESIYTVRGDGIYKVSRSTGEFKKMFSCASGAYISTGAAGYLSSESKRIQGKVNFLYVDGKTMYRGKLDMGIGKVTLARLLGNEEDSVSTPYGLVGLDREGRMLIQSNLWTGSSYVATIRAYDKGNKLLKEVAKSGGSGFTTIPVMNEVGLLKNFVVSSRASSGSYKYFYVETYGMEDEFYCVYSYRSAIKYLANTDPILAARVGSKVYVGFGGIWDYILNQGYLYDERATLVVADTETWSTYVSSIYDIGLDIAEEFGKASDMYMAIACADNRPGSSLYRSKVLGYGKDIWAGLEKNVDQFLGNEGEINIVAVCDKYSKLGGMSGSEYDNIKRKIEGSNAKLIYTDNLDMSNLSDKLINASEKTAQALSIDVTTGAAFMERNFKLDPSKTYYYEYDLKASTSNDLVSTNFKINELVDGSGLGPDKYYVTFENYEDFDDGRVNSFFALGDNGKINSGQYRACDSNSGKSSKNYVRGYGDTITFTVPTGKEAILSFDYNFQLEPYFTQGNGVWINGEKWDLFLKDKTSSSGSYVHKSVLKAGVTTINTQVTFYGMLPSYYKFYLDNLKVQFVESSPPAGAGWVGAAAEQKEAGATASGTRAAASTSTTPATISTHILGSFETPPSTISFGSQNYETYFEDFNDTTLISGLRDIGPGGAYSFNVQGGQYTHTAGKSCTGTLEFNIPTGKTGIARLNTWSSIGRSSISYDLGEFMWSNGINTNPQDPYVYMGSPYTIRLPNLTSIQNLNARNSYRDYTGIYDLELTLLPSIPQLTTNKYFLDKANLKMYFEQSNYGNEGTLRFDFSSLSGQAISIQNLKIYSVEEGAKSYVFDEYFGDMDNLSDWTTSGCSLSISKENLGEIVPETSMVFKKGELINYGINYYDYENDPSKKQYWRYTHEPANDGLNPISGEILNAGVERFYIDGKYTVEHWQEDDTGTSEFDKLSNVEALTLYIEGDGEAPIINFIRTLPSKVKEGLEYILEISVSDKENDILELRAEVYDSKTKLIYTYLKTDISPIPNSEVGGTAKYELIQTGFVTNGKQDADGNNLTAAIAGKYTVICRLRDLINSGIKSYSFLVLPGAKVSVGVSHTPKWEENRLSYNITKYSSFENSAQPALGLAPRGTEVFWPGERLVLAAQTTGQVESITAKILEAPEYTTTLTEGGPGLSGGSTLNAADPSPSSDPTAQNWQSELWDAAMSTKWHGRSPIPLTVRFTASFTPETVGPPIVKTQDVDIIVYKPEWYWELHREW